MTDRLQRLKTSMELEDEIDLHKKGWLIQRIGWAFLFVAVTASMLGLFGHGVLSKQRLFEKDIRVEYERFIRIESPFELRITIDKPGNGATTITISKAYLEEMRITSIQTEPASQAVTTNGVEFSFDMQDGATVLFFVEPQKAGTSKGELSISDVSFELSHYVYP